MNNRHNLLAGTTLLACIFSASARGQQSEAMPAPDLQRLEVHRNSCLGVFAPGVLHGGGAAYDVQFDAQGMRFEPALGLAAPTTQHFAMTPASVGRGGEPAVTLPSSAEPHQNERTAIFAHGAGVRERYAVGVDGVEVSWVFDQRPSGHGDLVVRYAIDTGLSGPTATSDGGLDFDLTDIGGVTVGAVTGIDAAGHKVAGALSYRGGVLEMSLPASFVDRATYPLVLDPVIGTKFGIWPVHNYVQPDCAYEKTEDRYLVTFLLNYASGDVRVRGQLVDRSTGALFGGVIQLTPINTTVLAFRPRVASFSRGALFGVVWAENIGTQTAVHFRPISPLNLPPASMEPTSTLATSALWTISDVDIGSEGGESQQNYAFKAVWDNTSAGRIYGARIGIDSSGSAVVHGAHTVFADSGFNSYSQPAIARAAESGGKLMVVARRYSSIGPQRGITSALVSPRDNTVSSIRTIVMDSTNEHRFPDVDGYGDEWVVSWRESTLGSSSYGVSTRSARLVGTSVQLGPTVSLGGSSLVQVDRPSVGYSHGKTWLGYRQNFFGATSLVARGIDSSSCESCQDLITEPVPVSDTRIVVGTTLSGNDLLKDEGLIVWSESSTVWAQRVSNHGNSGTVTNIGGGCGAGGNQNAQAPSIGMSQIYCSVTGLSPTAVLTMFNLTLSTTTVSCGPCEWLPASVSVIMPISQFQSATFSYSFPCAPWLVGAPYQTQWTTYDPGTTPCALYPGFAISDRIQHVVGQ